MSIDDMQDMRSLIEDQANRIFADLCTKDLVDAAERGEWPDELWRTLEENGLTLAAVPQELGGGGGGIGDGFAVLKLAGRHAAPVPLSGTFLAGWVLAQAGRHVPSGPLSLAASHVGDMLALDKREGRWMLSGHARRVPWGRNAYRLLVVVPSREGLMGALVDPKGGEVTAGTNLAGEPRDELDFHGVEIPGEDMFPIGDPGVFDTLRRLGAMTRAVMMAGALESALEMSVRYANERKQFGKPIGGFQAIQQQLAALAGQSAASTKIADLAVEALERGEGAEVEIAAAKARVGEAAGLGASIAHQVHAAMGFTYEHPLHQRTRRLWSWRDEYGSEPVWQSDLGRRIAQAGADRLWQFITRT